MLLRWIDGCALPDRTVLVMAGLSDWRGVWEKPYRNLQPLPLNTSGSYFCLLNP